MKEFFTNQPSFPPQLGFAGHLFLLFSLIVVVLGAVKYHENRKWQLTFKTLQAVQLVLLYGWYLVIMAPISESLPFYHCRMAMVVLLLVPDESPYKEYFSLMGVFGSICALIYPIFDPFPWFHVTIFSFVVGHLALLGNALNYLLHRYSYRLTSRKIAGLTFAINTFILLVDVVTGGDYGFLRNLPLIGNYGLIWNYLIESILFTMILSVFLKMFQVVQVSRQKENEQYKEARTTLT
ncbi:MULTISPECIES: YwaF family protein [unclassified Streptococcus]|uniref:YwaF family protein n=1 Tax=unclassified Streptococcus TaxID=2608887 RepID=UPI0010721ED5|nr:MULTISPECIES: YwaF family protein [unclassified Streptococcus]MBF0786770.1 YwaF family protein [Streptococcus sp. 19428wC2_LYSM12]MCQ9211007.1 YwaF family protein [Streptococcus sp. B01]MCQ9214280.1 YwaF family protein [Streptococcus sp. O1]TFV06312.1 TIGR02206 family membrane protein [Streptococcus sp. LYSM12]